MKVACTCWAIIILLNIKMMRYPKDIVYSEVMTRDYSGLRIAAIVGERLFHGFRFEAELLLINHFNHKAVLSYANPDLLLIELGAIDCNQGNLGTHSLLSCPFALIPTVIECARSHSIPTACWITDSGIDPTSEGVLLTLFDRVFCADQCTVDALSKMNIFAEFLPPCVQPSLFNPFRQYTDVDAPDVNVLFDGYTDAEYIKEVHGILNNLLTLDVTLAETRSVYLDSLREGTPNTWENVLHCPSLVEKIRLLKKSKSYISLELSLSSKLEQQWRALEAVACRLFVAYYGRLDDSDVRKGLVVECHHQEEFYVEFVRCEEDPLYRERVAHRACRNVNMYHTFAHRLDHICNCFGLVNQWESFPKVTIITATNRSESLTKCLTNYDNFEYPNKELVLVFNGERLPECLEVSTTYSRSDVIIVHVPQDLFAGASLNYGRIYSSGKYVFRVDDDDFYGQNYIMDMILMARCTGADLFGKSPAPIKFLGQREIFHKPENLTLTILPSNLLISNIYWFGGNSLSGTSDLINDNAYDDYIYAAADTAFQIGMVEVGDLCHAVIAVSDSFNLVAQRSADGSGHTWKVTSEGIIKTRHPVSFIADFFI